MGTATLTTNNAFRQDTALQAMTAFGCEKLLQIGDDMVNATNVSTNSTALSQLILYQGTPIYIEGSAILNKHHPAMLILGITADSDILSITGLAGNLAAWEWTASIEDAYIRANYTIVPKRTYDDFVKTYETRMSHRRPQKYADVDLPMMDEDSDW